MLFPLLLLTGALLAQSTTLRVYAPDGTPLEGAAVVGLPDNWSGYTDAGGELVPGPADTLVVSYLGLRTRRISTTELAALNGEITLQNADFVLAEVVVADRRLRKDLSQQKTVIDALDVQRAQVSTPAEALAVAAGAYVQMSQLGGGSPVLRGFEANRVLLVVDGVRMNNAIYRGGHLQNAVTVDENALARLEVSYGPGALAYGSDALGGVIHFRTKDPLPRPGARPSWYARAGGRVGTATAETTTQAELTYRSARWSAYTAVTASRFGDLRSGRRRPAAYPTFGRRAEYVARMDGRDTVLLNPDPDRQVGSGYEQLDLLQKITYRPSEGLRVQLNLQYSTSGNVPRYDRLIERRDGALRFAEWYYGPQRRLLAAGTLHWQADRSWADEVRVVLAHQTIDEDRYDRRFGSELLNTDLVNVRVRTLNLDLNRQIRPRTLLQYGALLRYDVVTSRAFRRSLTDGGIIHDVNSRYPSQGSDLRGADAFVQLRRHNGDSTLLAEIGARYGAQRLFARFGADDPVAWPDFYLDGITNAGRALNGAGGLAWRDGRWGLRAHLATGFRAPNIDDFAKFRENDGFVQIPNPELAPERTLSGDFSLSYRPSTRGRLELTAYRTWLRDAMVRENFRLPDGTDFFVDAGDTLFVQALVNAETARVWGLSFVTRYRPARRWAIDAQAHYTYGRRDFALDAERTIEVPLDHIPPLYGHLHAGYRKANWEAGARGRFQLAKRLNDYAVANVEIAGETIRFDRLGTADNLELTPPSADDQTYTGSYAWWTLDAYAAYRLGEHLRVRVNLNNAFDLHYRPFASGISAPGRNLVVGVYGWF